jgi:soluble lytic murein transglycosylase
LAAYNAGEKAVSKWEQISPQAPSEVFVENITYMETRQYVKLVVRNYAIYKRLYRKTAQ